MIPPIITAQELMKLRNKRPHLVDASGNDKANEQFRNEHLLGAFFLNLDKDLSSTEKDPKNGGRHPLPDANKFLKTLTQLGLSKSNHIVIYDHFYGALAAARAWWMLTSLGFKKVQVLSGGFEKAKALGYPLESGTAKQQKTAILIPNDALEEASWQLPTVNRLHIVNNFKNQEYLLIDVRTAKRYAGIEEPIDPVAGHIPSAINLPFMDNLDTSGEFFSPNQLYKKYMNYFEKYKTDNIAVYCGSGVTACHTLLAMAHAGFPIPNLYVGSWGEWCRNL